jgi:hypothetical protein
MQHAYKILVGKPLKERDHFGDMGRGGRKNIKEVVKEDMKVWTGLIWLSILTSDGLL